ncbi:hypothetical protein HK102_010582 [Quaeritorhiza haematococci]|nr:hypothetical protein HK102_010582 [Quaeritorhiza haematococci]
MVYKARVSRTWDDERTNKSAIDVRIDAVGWRVGDKPKFGYDLKHGQVFEMEVLEEDQEVEDEGVVTFDKAYPKTARTVLGGGLLSLGKGNDPNDYYWMVLWTSGESDYDPDDEDGEDVNEKHDDDGEGDNNGNKECPQFDFHKEFPRLSKFILSTHRQVDLV